MRLTIAPVDRSNERGFLSSFTRREDVRDRLPPGLRYPSKVLDVEAVSFKKVPPPTPDGREGRLFPPEQS
jgi:hypothetical protein